MKNILRLAAITIAAGTLASAQAQVAIYGTVDLAVGKIGSQALGAPNAPITNTTGVHNGGLQTSYIGFRGTEDLGDGLVAKFQLEAFFRADTGAIGRFDATPGGGADALFAREAFVGLAGRFGEIRLGNNGNPAWISLIQTNALGANSLFSPSFRQLFNSGSRGLSEVDTSMVNSVKYLSPVLGGVSGSVAVQTREGTGSGNSYSANLSYRGGPLVVTLANQNVRHAAYPNLPGSRDQNMTLIGGAYDFGVLRAFAQYTSVKNDRLGTSDKLPHFGITVPLGLGQIQLGTGQDKISSAAGNTSRRTTTLGYVYAMSKRTDLYTFAMRDQFPVGTGQSFVVGMRHQF